MMRYANGTRYCGGCTAFRTEHPTKKNRCVECNQLLRRLPRRTVHKTLYHQVIKERAEALNTPSVVKQHSPLPPVVQQYEIAPITTWSHFGEEGWYERFK